MRGRLTGTDAHTDGTEADREKRMKSCRDETALLSFG